MHENGKRGRTIYFRIAGGACLFLELPPIISKKLVEQEVEQVMLTSQKGSWEVQTHTFGGELYFTKGWDAFALQHDICYADLLLFEHTGGSSFKVRVLGATCCEKDFQGGRAQGKNAEDSVKLEVDIDEVPHDHAHDKVTKRGRTQGKNAEDSEDSVEFEVDLDEVEVDMDEVPSPVKIQKHDHAKKVTRRKRNPKVVNMSSTDRSQFVRSIKQYNIRRRSPYMHIPANFCLANGLYCNARICLKGPCSEQEVSLKVCRGGRTIYTIISRGWSEFIAGNDLKVGEICTFKLRSTEGSSNGVVFDVDVLRKST
ncbi:PREDICTED: putative B3 domain-containing protein Os03g0621600 isoform X3 [Ipomoea nil]|uniref:putative B3 domain-containing protein Os03g0621600 isoform X3 n=1 Tax=Ipomoea nil TaxID=35883 RepID=UPI000901E435|nr:PREDICTED: putative B3 domain-containing protein Os03g0621600 isoform X3 [Ipomoea nil]XP_019192309.1 PREDICTED: putative B3 domain-containing protein Os03g0621600 isoform X3 [Ipomoea nil]